MRWINRKNSSVMAAIIIFILLIAPCLSKGEELGDSIQEKIKEKAALQLDCLKSDLRIVNTAKKKFIHHDKFLYKAKAQNIHSGKIIVIYANNKGEILEAIEGEQNEKKLKDENSDNCQMNYGKMNPQLHQLVNTTNPSDKLSIGIWIHDPTITQHTKLDEILKAQPDKTKLAGSLSKGEIMPDTNALTKKERLNILNDFHRQIQEPVLSYLKNNNMDIQYISKYSPTIYVRLTPAQIKKLETIHYK